MTTVVGGLRERLIHDSCYTMLNAALDSLGWFDTDRAHAPVTFVARAFGPQDEPPLNSVSLAPQNASSDPIEMGSGLEENTHTYYVDVYAEDDSIGLHLSGDIKDILRGKFPSIGRSRPNVPVLDLRIDPVPEEPLFYCEIQDVIRDKAVASQKQWQRHWWAVRFDLVDAYDDEDDDAEAPEDGGGDGGDLDSGDDSGGDLDGGEL